MYWDFNKLRALTNLKKKHTHFNHHRHFWLSKKIANPPVSALEPHLSGRTPHPPDSLKMNECFCWSPFKLNTEHKFKKQKLILKSFNNKCSKYWNSSTGEDGVRKICVRHLTFHHLHFVRCGWDPPPGSSSHRGWSRGVPSLSVVLFQKKKRSSVIETFDCLMV